MRLRIVVLGAAALLAVAGTARADHSEWQAYAGACSDGLKPSRLGCIPEHASEVAVGFWACERPYFYSTTARDCVLVAPEPEIVVTNLRMTVTAAEGGAAPESETTAAIQIPPVLTGQGGCCANEGGIALDDDGKAICDAGRVLCENGAPSPTCVCTP